MICNEAKWVEVNFEITSDWILREKRIMHVEEESGVF